MDVVVLVYIIDRDTDDVWPMLVLVRCMWWRVRERLLDRVRRMGI